MPRKHTSCDLFIGNHASTVDGCPCRGLGFWCEDVPMDESPTSISDPTGTNVSRVNAAAPPEGFASVALNNNYLVRRRIEPKTEESGR